MTSFQAPIPHRQNMTYAISGNFKQLLLTYNEHTQTNDTLT